MFAGVGFDRNTFAGIKRRLEQQAGLQARVFAGGARGGGVAARLHAGSMLPAERRVIPNLKTTEDWRFNSESSVVASISSNIGLKISYVVRFDNLPQPGFSETDKIFTTGIQITF